MAYRFEYLEREPHPIVKGTPIFVGPLVGGWNKPFGRWGEVFGDPVVAAAMIDRLVHHAKVVSLKGDSYRLKDRDLRSVPSDKKE